MRLRGLEGMSPVKKSINNYKIVVIDIGCQQGKINEGHLKDE